MSAHTILYLDPYILRVGKVEAQPGAAIQQLLEYDWKPDTLAGIFEQIKITYQTNTVRIILSHKLSYIFCLPAIEKNGQERELVKRQLQAYVPDILNSVIWDFCHTQLNLHPQHPQAQAVQVVAVDFSLFQLLSNVLKQTQIKAEAIEPIAVSLARLTQAEASPHLVLYTGVDPLRIMAHKGVVLSSQVTGSEQLSDTLDHVRLFTQHHFGVTPGKLILAGDTSVEPFQNLSTPSFCIEPQALDPFVGIALKQDLVGTDEQVLNLLPIDQPQILLPPTDASGALIPLAPSGGQRLLESFGPNQRDELNLILHQPHPESVSTPNRVWLTWVGICLLTCILCVGAGLGILYGIRYHQEQTSIVVTTPPVPLTPKPTATPKLPSAKAAQVKVLNGSGQAGKAATVSQYLEALGYEDIETGNADNYDYDTTVIQTTAKTRALFDWISKDLETDFEVPEETEVVDTLDDADVVIIVGKGT